MSTETIVVEDNIVTSTFETISQEISGVIDSGVCDVILDLSEVSIIDSTGIGLIIRVQNTLKNINGSLSLTGVNKDIMRMFNIMRLDQHISMQAL